MTQLLPQLMRIFVYFFLQNLDEKLKSHGFNIFEMIYNELYEFSDKEGEDILRKLCYSENFFLLHLFFILFY
jgi:hypothetical protein